MDTNRNLLKVCVASLALCATAAGAQTIYKQVDAEGRVMFTDRPDPGVRVVAGYETSPSARSGNDVERAVSTYTPLATPLAFQMGATESARRARQEMHKNAASGVLIVNPAPRGRDPIAHDEAISPYYVMWAASFFLLASGLLFVGWQTFRLILRGAFPRSRVGIA